MFETAMFPFDIEKAQKYSDASQKQSDEHNQQILEMTQQQTLPAPPCEKK